MGHAGEFQVWIPGISEETSKSRKGFPASVRAIPAKPVRRALDLFCGTKSAAKVLEAHGYQVETLDIDPLRNPTICADVLGWDYAKFPPGHFELITAAPPCTEYSLAMNRRPRQLDTADRIVRKTLEVIEYFKPEKWWLETPRTGLLARRDFMVHYPQLDCDHCCFEEVGYQKPTRFFGSAHLAELSPVLCDGKTCKSLSTAPPGVGKHGQRPHLRPMGGNRGYVRKEQAYHIPGRLIEYVSGLSPVEQSVIHGIKEVESGGSQNSKPPKGPSPAREEVERVMHELRIMHIRALPEVEFVDSNPEEGDDVLEDLAKRILAGQTNCQCGENSGGTKGVS